jgi:flavodoxin I
LKQIGIFYGTTSGKTETVATRIYKKLGSENASIRNVAETDLTEMMNYRHLILGIPTWGIGELQDDWLMAIPSLEELDLTGKTVALFGLGDQESYPDTFADAMGKLYDALENTGCRFIGSWCTLGYNFEESKALRGDEFVGLVLDCENQDEMTEMRVTDWLDKLNLSQSN